MHLSDKKPVPAIHDRSFPGFVTANANVYDICFCCHLGAGRNSLWRKRIYRLLYSRSGQSWSAPVPSQKATNDRKQPVRLMQAKLEMNTHVGGLPILPPSGMVSRAYTAENPNGAPGGGGAANGGRKGSPAIVPFTDGQTVTLAEIEGAGCIRHIWITTPPGNPLHDRSLILRCYWDGQELPAVECPLGDFFGIAHGRRRPYASALTAMPEGRGLDCYFTMPFRTHARITLENDSGSDVSHLFYQVDATLGDPLEDETGCFHAQFRRQNPTAKKQDFVLLDGVTGRGRFLGCMIGVRTLDDHWWGEGEMKFYLDGDTDLPTICGTGAEDYAGSAWGLGVHHTPYHGCTLHEQNRLHGMKSDKDALISFYRWHVLDPVYFHRELRVELQQMGGTFVSEAKQAIDAEEMELTAPLTPGQEFTLFERQDDVCSTVFWYQTLPSPEFPELPDREARSSGLELRSTEREV